MRKISVWTVILMLTVFIAGCVSPQQLKTPLQMSPKERAVLALTLYNNSWDNYQAQYAATPQPMTDDMKTYFGAWKKMMVGAEPVIGLYSSTVNAGGLPTPEQEQQILNLIYTLQATLMRGGK